MFTKEDYQEYFSVIDAKEREMVAFLEQILPELQDERVISVLQFILNDERSHCALARALMKYLAP